MKKVSIPLIIVLIISILLIGCNKNSSIIQTCIISNNSYHTQEELESAQQKTVLAANESIYTSIHVIESPKGMKYNIKWYINGEKVKDETKATKKDMQDILVFKLEKTQLLSGRLKIEIYYDDTILAKKEVIVG